MIQYPTFRAWQAMQKRSNNSIVALAIGTNLATAEIARVRSTAPFTKVGEALAGVARTENLDVTTTQAKDAFRAATEDMAFLAVPQIVALHIELCVGTVKMCQRFPGLVAPHKKGLDPERWFVPELAKAVRFGQALQTADYLMSFCVKLRNTIMHGAGRVDGELADLWKRLPSAAKKRWSELTGRPFTYAKVGALPTLEWPEVKAVLAVTKESAKEINARVERKLTREQWAKVIVADYRDESRHGKRRYNSTLPGQAAEAVMLRRLGAHAATYYRPLSMTKDELVTGRESVR